MYQIISDGSCDLGVGTAKQYGVHVVPFYVSMDGELYKKEIEEIGVLDFYQQMLDHPEMTPKSSLPSIQDFVNAFLVYAEQGVDILCLCITTKFSGSYNSAMTARELVNERYPDVVIRVVDTTVNTVLQGLLVIEAAKMRQAGLSLEQAADRIEAIKKTGRIFFTIENMDYLVKGGRAGKVAGAITNRFSLRPVIVLKEGEIFLGGIARGRRKSMDKVIQKGRAYFEENHLNPGDFSFAVGVGYNHGEAEPFREDVLRAFEGELSEADLPIRQIGATIGVHTGPLPVGFGVIERWDSSSFHG